MNHYRYTFIYKIVKFYRKDKRSDEFMGFLKTLPSSYIWKIFKELLDILAKVETFDSNNFTKCIADELEILTSESMQNIVVPSTGLSTNHINNNYPKFKINFNNDFVIESKPGTYTFQAENNFAFANDLDTKTQLSGKDSSKPSFSITSKQHEEQESNFTARNSDEVFEQILISKTNRGQELKPFLELQCFDMTEYK